MIRLPRFVLVACMVGMLGCSSVNPDTVLRDATISSNTAASLIESLQSTAIVMYRAEQEIQIATASNNGETKEQAKSRVMVVRVTWAPIWEAFAKVRAAHSALALMLTVKPINPKDLQTTTDQLQSCILAVQALMGSARNRVERGIL